MLGWVVGYVTLLHSSLIRQHHLFILAPLSLLIRLCLLIRDKLSLVRILRTLEPEVMMQYFSVILVRSGR